MMINIILGVYIFILGCIFASFFGVIIARVPNNLSIVKPSSRCDNCGHVLKWYENIPLISFIFLGGKCSNCKCKIGYFSFIYELLGGISSLLAFIVYGVSFEFIFVFLITLVLLLIAGYDYQTHYVLDAFLWILGIFCLAYFLFLVFVKNEFYFDYIFSVILGVVFFVLVMIIGKIILKKDALGEGDVYLTGIIASVLKPFSLILGILIASLWGSIVELTKLKLLKNNKDIEIAFCPYLCLGFYIVLLFGNTITNWLLG